MKGRSHICQIQGPVERVRQLPRDDPPWTIRRVLTTDPTSQAMMGGESEQVPLFVRLPGGWTFGGWFQLGEVLTGHFACDDHGTLYPRTTDGRPL